MIKEILKHNDVFVNNGTFQSFMGSLKWAA